MPITLAQAKVGMANHVDQQVIDQFRRGSMLLNALTFDNSVSPGTGGSTLTYGYTQLKTPAGADFRDINADYTETVADRETKSVDLKIFGGTFKIDRVLANTANGQINEVQFQLEEHIRRPPTCSTTPPSTATRAPRALTVWTRCLSALPPSSTPTHPRLSTCPPRRRSTPTTRPCSICLTSSSPSWTACRLCSSATRRC